jgi:DNA-directed RNA polymerase specialized sigma24 family protein
MMNVSLSNLSLVEEQVPVLRRKWTLTQEAFDAFLTSLAEDRESAGERYLEIRSNLIKFFEWRGGPYPEDHADETINRIAKRVYEKEDVRNPAGYYLGVARMILFEINRTRVKQDQTLKELTEAASKSNVGESESRIDCLRHCLRRLSTDNRELILQYYNGEKREKIDRRKRLADQLGIPAKTLRMRAVRIREHLRHSVENCSSC